MINFRKKISPNKAITLALLVITVLIVACSGSAAPVQAPKQALPQDQQSYSMQVVDSTVNALVKPILEQQSRKSASTNGWASSLTGLAFVILLSFLTINMFGRRGTAFGLFITFLLAIGVMIGRYNAGYHKIIPNEEQLAQFVVQKGDEITRYETSVAADRAIKESASSFQIIAADISAFGKTTLGCDNYNRWSSSSDECYRQTDYYSTDQECTGSGDDETCWTEYTSWFPYVQKFWYSPATKAKYIFEPAYKNFTLDGRLRCYNPENQTPEECTRDANGVIDDRRQPVFYLTTAWHAPEAFRNNWYSSADYSIPETWQKLAAAKAATDAGQTAGIVVGGYLGKYANWSWAGGMNDDYSIPYEHLSTLTTLPDLNNKTWFNYPNSLTGHEASLNTPLYTNGSELPDNFNQVTFIGFDNLDPSIESEWNSQAREFQGTFGPPKTYQDPITGATINAGKEMIFYGFAVNHQIVQNMGGIRTTTLAIMGWLQDCNVQGLLCLPKNAAVMVFDVSEDGRTELGRAFEPGLPQGNTLVRSDLIASFPGPHPFVWNETMGNVSGQYFPGSVSTMKSDAENWGQSLTSYYNDLTFAGGAIGVLYANNLPEHQGRYAPPDPNSEDCSTSAVDHPGVIRYQMCNNEWVKTTLEILEESFTYIKNDAITNAQNAVPVDGTRVFFALVFVVVASFIRTGSFLNDL